MLISDTTYIKQNVRILIDATEDMNIGGHKMWRLRNSQYTLFAGSPLWYFHATNPFPRNATNLNTLAFRVEAPEYGSQIIGYFNKDPPQATYETMLQYICEVEWFLKNIYPNLIFYLEISQKI